MVASLYADGEYLTRLSHRVLAVDGSKLRLPDTTENRATFGVSKYANQLEGVSGAYPMAIASTLYDVLNNVCLDAILEPVTVSELDLAQQHCRKLQPNDLVIFDRGYGSYGAITSVLSAQADYIIRCSKASFKVANEMFSGNGPDSIITTIVPSQDAKYRQQHTNDDSTSQTVRFVRVLLDTGEYEVLVTSLLDEKKYPTGLFKELYWLRWGVETFYGILKTVLSLENFTGTSPESIRQDFFASVFLSNLEPILTTDSDEKLTTKATKNTQKVNKAVSFNIIKHRAFDLLSGDDDIDVVLSELTALFLMSPTQIREHKNPPRQKSAPRKVLDFFRRKKKVVF